VEKIRPDVPPALAQIVRRAMSRDPAERYQKASELRNSLAEFVDGSRPAAVDAVAASAASVPPLPARKPARGPLYVALGLVAILVAGAAALMREREPEPPPPQAGVPVPVIPAMPPPAPQGAGPDGAEAAPAEEPKAETRAAPRKKVEPPPSPPTGDGTVTIAVAPWGEVLVDGIVQGVSPPLTQLTLPPGLRTIEIRNGTSPPFVARVEVRPGEKVQLQHRF
jgi:serine/threonine-protein kinase